MSFHADQEDFRKLALELEPDVLGKHRERDRIRNAATRSGELPTISNDWTSRPSVAALRFVAAI